MAGSRRRPWPLAVALLAAGCPARPGAPAAPTGPPAPETVEVAPFSPPQAPAQALILGTGPGARSSIIPLATHTHTVAIDGTWADPSGSGGSLGTVRLTTTPQAGGLLHVGVAWSFAVADQEWPSAAWVGAFLATQVLGVDLADYRFDAVDGGRIDRAGSGALVAAGYLAALTGAAVAPDATVIGIVNPDGTVGPVEHLAQLVAAARGKKNRIGVPASQSGGAGTIPVTDLYGAYTLLTGKALPPPQPVAAADMALPADVRRDLTDRYRAWRTELGKEWAQLVALRAAGRLPGALAALASLADARGHDAEKRLRDGAVVTAYDRIVDAVTYARAANAAATVLTPVQAGDIAGARQTLTALQQQSPNRAPLEALAGAPPRTIGDLMATLAALADATAGWSFERFAGDRMAAALAALAPLAGKTPDQIADPQLQEDLMAALVPPLLAHARAASRAQVAADALALARQPSTAAFDAPTAGINRLASAYAAVATANLAGCGRRLLAERPAGNGDAQVALMRADPDYLIARMAFELWRKPTGAAATLRDAWGADSPTWSLARLAGSVKEYGATGVVVAREYSLAAHLDDDTGAAVGVGHPRALAKLLVAAERAARQHAHAARVATGIIPLQARLRYQHAKTLAASRTPGDRVDALAEYWASSAYSQLAVALARLGVPPAPAPAAAPSAG